MEATSETADLADTLSAVPAHTSRPQCCCGRPGCAYLEHNNAALGGLERDLETAARLGQALLSRHESYISDSQAEHARLTAYINELESDRMSLQSANEKIVAENRDLLSQLEALNTNLANSDNEVDRLEQQLLDCELEVKRLNGLVRRTDELDGRVQEMEKERVELCRKLDDGREESRTTLARWRDSERKVRALEDEVKRIEIEARMDRERHEEIVARIENERALERELGGAEGRLKGAAAVHSMTTNGAGSKNVISHFVRDILKDNANLQAGVAELRELLQTSNEEVQNLRDQVMLHQPVSDDPENQSLDQQLEAVQPSPKQVQQEVHVHHHYHAKLAKKDKPPTSRRPTRRRPVMHGHSSDWSSPSTPVLRPAWNASSPAMSLNAHQLHSRGTNRWSMASNATASTVVSSLPSSPRSYFDHNSSLFDRLEQNEEYSRPTSPESMADPHGPSWRYAPTLSEDGLGIHSEQGVVEKETPRVSEGDLPSDDIDECSIDGEDATIELCQVLTPKPSTILEAENEDNDDDIDTPTTAVRPPPQALKSLGDLPIQPCLSKLDVPMSIEIPDIRPSLQRRSSHESLVSISGMDIHIARRPAATATLDLLRGNASHFALSPSPTRKVSASQPLASVTEYTVLTSPSLGVATSPSIHGTPSSIQALHGIAIPAARAPKATSSPGTISKLGGWVRGKWGVAPLKSVTTTSSTSSGTDDEASSLAPSVSSTSNSANMPTPPTVSTPCEDLSKPAIPVLVQDIPTDLASRATQQQHVKVDVNILFAGRSPGVNQRGAIPGFRAHMLSRPTPSEVIPSSIDEDGLKDGLTDPLFGSHL